MKKTQEILGLPIISISDGVEVGIAKSIILNADKGSIDFIIVDSGIQMLSTRVISSESILGIGEYALTIENESEIMDINKLPDAMDLLQKNINIKGTKLLTKKGRMIGEIGDFYVDEDDRCNITGVEFISRESKQTIPIIPRESVITFGKNLVVVKDDVESSLLADFEMLVSESEDIEFEKKKSGQFSIEREEAPQEVILTEEIEHQAEVKNDDSSNELSEEDESQTSYTEQIDIIQEISNEDKIENDDMQAVSDTSVAEDGASNLFELRQRQYLIGRRATKTIYDAVGNVIVNEGTVLNEEIISIAKQNGKLIELVMNNKA